MAVCGVLPVAAIAPLAQMGLTITAVPVKSLGTDGVKQHDKCAE